MASYKFVVLSNPVEGQEEAYNAWYDGRHLDDVLRADGFVAAQRFEEDNPLGPQPPSHRYLAIYDVETDDIARTFSDFLARAGTDEMPVSPALADDVRYMLFRARGPARRADG